MKSIFDKASEYAIKRHQNQRRKDGSLYILHPFEVVSIVSTITLDEEILASAMLHDVIEECDVEIHEIKELFTDRVAKIVELETEPKFLNLSKKDSWKLRKEEIIKRLKKTDEIGFKIVFLADKLSNIRSLYRDIEINGLKAFDKFNNNSIDEQEWFYYSALNEIRELKNTSAYQEFLEKLNYIFKKEKRNIK